MYNNYEPYDVESACYDFDHVNEVCKSICNTFPDYFSRFINSIDQERQAGAFIDELKSKFKVIDKREPAVINRVQLDAYKRRIAKSIEEFEKDRNKYLSFLDEEALAEYKDDPSHFKSRILKHECPIIHSTIYNTEAKALDQYRKNFSIASPKELLDTVTNLYNFASNYANDVHSEEDYENIQMYDEMRLSGMDDDEGKLSLSGVIGGGIRSHFIYKMYPGVFPNRSREALWALWFLTEKQDFGCSTSSEFLMIDTEKSITQQNYFYPYELFAFYAYKIYKLLNEKATNLGAFIDPTYRYVVVDSFLGYIAQENQEGIQMWSNQIANNGLGHI